MTIEIDITREDYSDFNIHHFVKTRLLRTVLTGIATIILMEYLLNRDGFHLIATVVSVFVCIIIYVVLIVTQLQKTSNIPKDGGTILGIKILQFNEDSIICKASDSTTDFKWSLISRIDNGKKAIYLYLETNMAIIIPKRYFSTESEQIEFIEFVNKRINKLQ